MDYSLGHNNVIISCPRARIKKEIIKKKPTHNLDKQEIKVLFSVRINSSAPL